MKHWFLVTKRWSLAIASAATLTIGAMALLSCGGEGGPVNGGGGGGGGNSYTQQFQALLPPGQAGATNVGPQVCATCHNGTSPGKGHKSFVAGEPYYDEWAGTMHYTKNVTCESCHGPGSNHANSATPDNTTILGVPGNNSPIICAQCHGPIYDQWKDTKHAEVFPENSSPRTSRCIQCHSGLFRTETAEQGIDVGDPNQLSDQRIADLALWAYGDSTHAAIIPHSANCATCHNPHKTTGPDNLTWKGEERQLRHTETNTDTSTIVAGNPASNFVNFNQICAQCHNGRAPDNSDATLATNGSTSRPAGHHNNQFNVLMGTGGSEGSGTIQRNMAHATAPGQCSHCHMPNSNHSYTVSYDVSCQPCHTGSGAAENANSVKTTVINTEYSLLTRMQNWSFAQFGDRDLWDYTSNITAKGKTPPNQSLIPIQMRRARANYWYILIDNSMGVHDFPYVTTLMQVASDNLTTLGVSPPPPGRGSDLTTGQKLQILREQQALLAKAEEYGN